MSDFSFSFRSYPKCLWITSVSDIQPTIHCHCPHSHNFTSSVILFSLSRFCAFCPLRFIHTCTMPSSSSFYHHVSMYLFCIIYFTFPPLYVEEIEVTALLSNRILRDNVQHPRYEPLRVQILRERRRGRPRLRQKKLWYSLVGLCHGVSGIQHFKLKYLTDNQKQTELATY